MNAFLLVLLFLGVTVVQIFIGGMRPVFSIPGYLLLAIAGLASVFLLKKNRARPSLLCLGSAVALTAYVVWRTFASPVEYLSRPDRDMVLACLVVYLIFALYITEPKQRLYFFYALFVLGVGHIALGVIQFTQQNGYLPFGYTPHTYGSRAAGFYFCPNHYAGLLEMLSVIAFAIGCWGRVGIKTRMILLYFALVAIAGLGISGSRGGYLSLGIAFLVFTVLTVIVIRWIRPGKALLIGTAAAGLMLLVAVAGAGLLKKNLYLATRVNGIVDAKNMRLQLWATGMKIYHMQPTFGAGAGTYYYLGRTYRDPILANDPVWVHNDYIHLLAEYGWVGGVACALFLGFHLSHGISGLRQIVKNRLLPSTEPSSSALALNIGALSGIGAILAHSFVDFNVHIPGNALVLAALFGILANPPTFRPRKSESSMAPVLPFRLLIPVCALVLILLTVKHWRGEWHSEKSRRALISGKYLTALKEAQLGLEVEKTNPDLHYYLGEARRLFGNSITNIEARNQLNEAALGAFADSVKLFPQDEKLWIKMSQSLDMLGRHEEAFAHLEKARALDPNLSALNTYYAAHFQIQGDDQKALEYYLKAKNFELAQKSRNDLLQQIQADGAR